jgi:hypothetical protein
MDRELRGVTVNGRGHEPSLCSKTFVRSYVPPIPKGSE